MQTEEKIDSYKMKLEGLKYDSLCWNFHGDKIALHLPGGCNVRTYGTYISMVHQYDQLVYS